MTAASDRGIFVGTRVQMTESECDGFRVGYIVTLSCDDDSTCPEFKNDAGKTAYISLDSVKVVEHDIVTLIEGGYTQSQKHALDCFKAILEKALKVRNGEAADGFHTSYGICDNIPRASRDIGANEDKMALVKDNIIRRVPSYSGNYHFPVACPDKPNDVEAAHTAWDRASCKWTGPYGDNRVKQLAELIHIVEHEWDEAFARPMTPAKRVGITDGVLVMGTRDNQIYRLQRDDGSADPYFENISTQNRTSIDLRYIRVVQVDTMHYAEFSVAEFLEEIEKQEAAKAQLEAQVAELQAKIAEAAKEMALLDYGLAITHKVKRLNK